MNFKSTSFLLLSISLLVQSPNVLAKNSSQEIKNLQTSLVQNKNSIDNLLNTKAHIIPKETDSLISGSGRFTSLSSVVRQVSLDSIKNGGREDLFAKPTAIAELLKNLNISTDENRAEISANPNEKIYSLTVLNPQNLEVLKKSNEVLYSLNHQEDDLIKRMTTYMDLSMKGKRYITFREAETLSNQIAKMNSDLQHVEELQVLLSAKEQAAVETFKKNMNEWLNKRIVFIGINKKGFKTEMKSDFAVWLPVSKYVRSIQLEKNYTSSNVAVKLKQTIIQSVNEHRDNSNWDDFGFVVPRENPGFFESNTIVHKLPVKDLADLDVSVDASRQYATISTKKFIFTTPIGYGQTSTFILYQNGQAIYNHNSQNESDYYHGNSEEVRVLLKLVTAEEIQMKSIYKNYGLDTFGKDLGITEFSLK